MRISTLYSLELQSRNAKHGSHTLEGLTGQPLPERQLFAPVQVGNQATWRVDDEALTDPLLRSGICPSAIELRGLPTLEHLVPNFGRQPAHLLGRTLTNWVGKVRANTCYVNGGGLLQ
jgi:hypothetical protein